MAERTQIWTVGHSTHPIEEFVALLKAEHVQVVADVRAFPASRRWPQFNGEALADSLGEAGIGYEHFPELGGRRKTRADSRNTRWRNDSFRGYADYMETEDFAEGAARLTELAGRARTAVMCAEALWWRCHRSLIADYLKAKGWEVRHIGGKGGVEEHPYTAAARVVEGRLSYEGAPEGELF